MFFLKKMLIIVPVTLLTFLVLGLIILVPNAWLVLLALLVWLLVSGLAYFYLHKNFSDLGLLLLSELSFFGLVILVEWGFLRWLLLVLAGISVFLLLLKMQNIPGLSFYQKPVRRIKMILWVFDVYAIFTVIFALDLFFISVPFWLLILVAGVVGGVVAIMIWQMYTKVEFRQVLFWSGLIGLVVVELVWVLHLLPLGYLVLGALVTWLWFLMQVFIRFHLSPRGIIWKNQMWFLITNFILFFIILFFIVRWI